jgi:hypothetical protein
MKKQFFMKEGLSLIRRQGIERQNGERLLRSPSQTQSEETVCYIGSHAVDQLLNKGFKTIAVDHLQTGHRKAVHEVFH